MKVELPMWRIAFSTGMLGVGRVALVGSVMVAMVDLDLVVAVWN
jgi:hypothetical protein